MCWKRIVGLLVFSLALCAYELRAGDAQDNAAALSLRKIIRRYALTSANDFQQRDPQDWRLLGSNDGGKSWTTLDQRSGEVFTERHQRRIFSVATTNAFNVYRLQIERVREPKAANCVQLAELELMGEGADDSSPTPIFLDHITAQGENPPLETAAHLFDGHIETKWLDRPQNRAACSSWVQWEYFAPTGTSITNIGQLLGLRAHAAAGYRVRFEGVVAGRTADSQRIEILDNTGLLELPALPELQACRPGQRVSMEGISEWTEKQVRLGQCRIQVREPKAPEAPLRIAPEQALAAGTDFQWVEAEGTVQFKQVLGEELAFELQEGSRSLRVRARHSESAETRVVTGQRLQIRGVCRGGFNSSGKWVAASLWASEPGTWTAVQKKPAGGELSAGSGMASSGELPTSGFTKIEQIRQLDREQLARRPHVKIRGVITGLLGAYVQDDTAGIQVAFKPEDNRRIQDLAEYVEVEGWVGLSDTSTPIISADRVVLLGRGKLPRPQRPPWWELASGRLDAVWVEMDGVVRATDGAHLLLNCDGRQVTASVAAAAVPLVTRLVDAQVRVRGVGVAALDDWGRMRGVHLLIPSLEYLQVRREPPAAFSQPIQPIRNLLKVGGAGSSFHRVRVEGVLTLQDGQRLFLQDKSGAAMAIFKQEVVLDSIFGRAQWSFWRTPSAPSSRAGTTRFSPGEHVEVVGFEDTHGYSPVLTEALVRKATGTDNIEVREITASSFADEKLDCSLVKLEGELVGQQLLGEHLVLELLSHGRTLQAFMPAGVGPMGWLEPGSSLQITGVWQMDPVPYAELGRRVGAVRILARSREDLVVLARPSWWTVQRALVVIGGMAFVLLAASVWITQLRRKVEERSVQLSAEIHRREQMEHQRVLEEERARIAQDLHDDLGAALTQIRFLSAVESRDQAVPEGTRAQLRQVSEKSHQLVASLDEIVWAINPANDSVPNLANYLCHAAPEFFATTPIRCRLDVDDTFPAVTLTSEVRHNLYLAVREALNNIAKHAGATEVWLRFHWKEQELEIAIEDNGRGFAEGQAPAGNGLRNMRQRIEKIGGRFECASQAGVGTTCRMWLSLRDSSF